MPNLRQIKSRLAACFYPWPGKANKGPSDHHIWRVLLWSDHKKSLLLRRRRIPPTAIVGVHLSRRSLVKRAARAPSLKWGRIPLQEILASHYLTELLVALARVSSNPWLGSVAGVESSHDDKKSEGP